jgi:hypothetical protein
LFFSNSFSLQLKHLKDNNKNNNDDDNDDEEDEL